MVLQSVYWRQGKAEDGIYNIALLESSFREIVSGRKTPGAILSNLTLACAVSLGLRLNIIDLHILDNSCVGWFSLTSDN